MNIEKLKELESIEMDNINSYLNTFKGFILDVYHQGIKDGVIANECTKDEDLPNDDGNDDIDVVGEPLYKVGLFSDVHFEVKDPNDESEYEDDLRHALKWWNNQGCDFICSCGDLVYTNVRNGMNDIEKFDEVYKNTTSLNLYSSLGNHDNAYVSESEWVKYILSHGGSSCIKLSNTNDSTRDSFSYYFEKEGDIFVVLSPYLKDGSSFVGQTKTIISDNNVNILYNKIPSDYLKLHNLTKDMLMNKGHDEFNYEFYRTDDLIGLTDLLERYSEKRVFIFTHYYMPHKSGNGNPATEGYYSHSVDEYEPSPSEELVSSCEYSHGIIPYNYDSVKASKGEFWWHQADCLCGIQMHYINSLINRFNKSIWFSGHSHVRWNNQDIDKYMNICNVDFEINEPNQDVHVIKNEYHADENPCKYEIVIENCKANSYMRKSNNVIKENCGYTVHIPSLSRPNEYGKGHYIAHYYDSEGGLMEVYDDCVVIRGISFKHSDKIGGEYQDEYVQSAQYKIDMKRESSSVDNGKIKVNISIKNSTNSQVTLDDGIAFYLANPDMNGNYYGWEGCYNRYPHGGHLMLNNGNKIVINSNSTKEFNGIEMLESNEWKGGRTFADYNTCMVSNGKHNNVKLYIDGVSEYVITDSLPSNSIITNDMTILINITNVEK